MQRVVVLGHTGMLGKYVSSYLGKTMDVINIGRSMLDALEPINIDEIFSSFNPGTVIINCMGIIKQKDSSIKDMVLVNSVFPHLLQEACEKYKLNLIHITTDCVFSGRVGNYNEFDEHDAIDVYGKSKSFGEPKNACVIRTSIIGEDDGHSLLSWVVSNRGKAIDGYTNHIWNGVTCLELAKIIKRKIDEGELWVGVRHVFTGTPINKYGLCEVISNVYNLGIGVIKTKTIPGKNMTLKTLFYSSLIVEKSYRSQIEEQKKFKYD